MAINFPDAPVLDQVYTDPTCGSSWRWDGITWNGEVEETDLGPIVSLLERDLDLYVATTGNDTTGDGTQALPWATPHRAMAYLSKLVLATGVKATVFVADGDYTFTQSLNLGHPQGTQININGTSTTGTRPTGTALNGNGVRGNTTATESFNNTKLRAYYNTRWQFNGCTGLFAELGGGVTVDKVLIRGSATASTHGVRASKLDGNYGTSLGCINLGATVAIHNFGGWNIMCNFGGSIEASFVTSTNAGVHGIGTSYGGAIVAADATISNCAGSGIVTNLGGGITARNARSSNNSSYGFLVGSGGQINAISGIASNNASDGLRVSGGGSVNATSFTATSNAGNGISVSWGGSIIVDSATASSNSGYGINISYGGVVNASNATALSNTLTNVMCSLDGFIRFTGGNAAGLLSPAANTLGNGKAYIQV